MSKILFYSLVVGALIQLVLVVSFIIWDASGYMKKYLDKRPLDIHVSNRYIKSHSNKVR